MCLRVNELASFFWFPMFSVLGFCDSISGWVSSNPHKWRLKSQSLLQMALSRTMSLVGVTLQFSKYFPDSSRIPSATAQYSTVWQPSSGDLNINSANLRIIFPRRPGILLVISVATQPKIKHIDVQYKLIIKRKKIHLLLKRNQKKEQSVKRRPKILF